METQNKDQKKGKKTLHVILYILAGIILLALSMGVTIGIQQCARPRKASAPVPAVTEIPTDTPAPTPLPDRVYDYDVRPAFDPDLSGLGLSEDEISGHGEDYFATDYWLNMTPDNGNPADDCAVIRHIGLGYTYAVYQGRYYRLGEGDDGKGVVDTLFCDLNADDIPELLYTYHFGTGSDAQSKVGWFDFATFENKVSQFGMQNAYLALNSEGESCLLYRCSRDVADDGGYALGFEDCVGEIVEQMGELFLILR